MQAMASRITAPSMQPPETEPCISPASSTISMLPAGRGEEPQVETTVATATLRPASRQPAACSSRRSSVWIMPYLPSREAATHSLSPSARRVPSRLSTVVRSRRLPRLWAGRKSSTWRIIAFAPVEMGA